MRNIISFFFLEDAVRRTTHGKSASNHEIDTCLGVSLVGARDRDNGRQNRKKSEGPAVEREEIDD